MRAMRDSAAISFYYFRGHGALKRRDMTSYSLRLAVHRRFLCRFENTADGRRRSGRRHFQTHEVRGGAPGDRALGAGMTPRTA